MTDLIQRLAEAIFRQEGMPPTHTNPGNLRGAPWKGNPVIRNGFWVPASRGEGVAGAVHVIALAIARGKSLQALILQWAPTSENNTEAYIENVKKWASIPDASAPLWDLL